MVTDEDRKASKALADALRLDDKMGLNGNHFAEAVMFHRRDGEQRGRAEMLAEVVEWHRNIENATNTGGVDKLSENCVRACAGVFADKLQAKFGRP